MNDTPTLPETPTSDEVAALRAIVEGTAGHTGQKFFQSLVRHLAAAVGTRYAFVAEFADGTRVRTLAFWFRDQIADDIEWDVTGTPCEEVVRGNLCHHPAGVARQFPEDRLLLDWGIESYLGVPLRDAQGRHLGHLAVFDDRPMPAEPRKLYTFHIFAARAAAELERLQFEERLRESEQRWRSLTEALPQLVWSATPDGACDYFSTQWTQHTGVPESGLLGWSWLDVLHPDDRERTRQVWTDSVAGRGHYDVEYRVRRSDGVYRWFKTRGTPLRDIQGGIVKWIGTCTDITDVKQAEAVLRTSEQRQRLILDNAQDAFVAMSEEGLITEWNRHAEITFGWPRAEAVGRVLCETIVPSQFREAHTRGLARFLEVGEGPVLNRVIEVPALRRDGCEFPAEISIASVRLGEKYLFAAFIRDVTQRKCAEEELHRAKEAAESANRAKDEFLTNVSHEIRTPMNAILGMTDLVLGTPLASDQRQNLQTVKSAADNLLGIISDLLDFAKIEAGKLELSPSSFSLRAVVVDTLRALAVRASSKGLELTYQVHSGVPDTLVGDAGRLRQILVNLVANAVKFTEKGEVVAGVDASGHSTLDDEVELLFEVRDTGIGIPLDKQERIFQAFEQEDTSTTRKYGGTGLGLTIATRLVDLMGGQISVESTPGQGSTFTFTARFGLQPHPAEPTATQPPVLLRDLQVLIVDDNATNRHILQEWLRGWQAEPAVAGDGVGAMGALWEAASRGRPFDLVLLDARMPETDGLALAAQIRKRAELSATRIILLSSGDRPGDWGRIRELQIDAHLFKPIPQAELLDTISKVMNRTNGDEPREAPPGARPEVATSPASASPPLHILVAEDSEFSARFMEQLLAGRGHRVRLTANGLEALSLTEKGYFDLLLLDIHMPGLDGFEVVRAIRERERTTGEHLPVMALTARSREEDRERCLAAGMDEFLTKPVAPAALLAVIDRLVPTHVESRPDQAVSGASEPLLNPVAVMRVCGADAEALRRMCQDFQTYAPARLAEVSDAISDRNVPRLRQAAHKFCALLFAFSTVAGNVASELENVAAGDQLERAHLLLGRLEAMTQELLRLVDGLSLENLHQRATIVPDANGSGSQRT